MRMPRSLVLIALTARASVSPLCARASLSFQRAIPPLAPSRFLPLRDLRKKTGAEVQRLVESELTPAQIPRASFSPHRELSPVLFIQPDQRPSASVSDLVSFGGSDDELADDSMSLVASDAEELCGSVTDPAPQVCPRPAPPKPGWMPNFSVSSPKRLRELGLEWSPPEEPSRSRLDEWFLPGRRQAPQQRPSPFFPEVHDELTRSWRSPYSAASVLPLHLPSLRLMALKKRDMRGCLNWMSQWLHISAHPLPSAGRRKPVTRPSHAGPLQRSLDAPTLQLDRRLRRSTLWRFTGLSGQAPLCHRRV